MRDVRRKVSERRFQVAEKKWKTLNSLKVGETGILHTDAFSTGRGYSDVNNASACKQRKFTSAEMVRVGYTDSYYGEVVLTRCGDDATVMLRYDKDGFSTHIPCFESCEVTQEMISSWLDEKIEKDREGFVKALPVRPNSEGGIGKSGSDPEMFFVVGKEVLPAFQVLGKKAEKPSYSSVRTFWDGYQAEMSVPPAGCHEALLVSINNGLHTLLAQAREVNPSAKLSWAPEVRLPLSALAGEKEEFVKLGCDPSLNIYGTAGIQVDDPRLLPWRFAGCHMHFSTHQKSPQQVENTVKAMDAIGGVILTAALEGMETDIRRQYYGRAGEYRLPKHGIEYRTPSAAILATPALAFFAFDLVRFAFGIGQKGLNRVWEASDEEVQDCVNNLNIPQARKVIRRNKDVFLTWVDNRYAYGYSTYSPKALTLVTKGVRHYMPIEKDKTISHLDSTWGERDRTPQRFENFLKAM
jgi:hypothetical protein